MEVFDDQPDAVVGDDPIEFEMPDSTNFFEEVDADFDVDWTGDDLDDGADDHVMSPMMDVLQCLGVSAADSANYCAQVIKDSPKRITQFGSPYNPTFFEVYGQGNIVRASHGVRRNLNVNGMRAFDLRTCKPSGEAWDFNKPSDRKEARQFVEEEKPTWVIGCPPCTFFSLWNQSMNHRKMDPSVVEKLRREAVRHLRFVIGLYRIQLSNGRHFLHEHPETATSWSDPAMLDLLSLPKVSSVVSDQCEYGLLTPGPGGVPMAAKKPTRWASSSPHMLKRLSKRCSKTHVHQQLVGGRAKACENYPLELITEILRGIRDTADHEEEWGDECVSSLDATVMSAALLHDTRCSSLVAAYRAQDLEEETNNLSVKFKHSNGRTESMGLKFKEFYKDEYTNEELPMGHVRMAMKEELEYFCDKVWVGVPLHEDMADP